MSGSIAERMDAGWQAARHWETECEAARNQLASVTAERDSWRQVHKTALDHAEEREKHHAETVARLTAERDAYLETIRTTFDVLAARGYDDNNAPLHVNVRRVLDVLEKVAEERDRLRRLLAEIDATRRVDALGGHAALEERDNLILDLQAQLAALKKRLADAPRKMLYPRDEGEKTGWVAMITLEDGE